ncbi:hypothetical protein ACFV0H_30430 [Streptomyces erythrochromogenes]
MDQAEGDGGSEAGRNHGHNRNLVAHGPTGVSFADQPLTRKS